MTAPRRIAMVGCRPPKSYTSIDAYWMQMDRKPVPEDWTTYEQITWDVRVFVANLPEDVVLVSGAAAGVDSEARGAAFRQGVAIVEHLPDYAKHGRRAPLERNTLIVADADELHAWPAPWSRGTWDTIRKAQAAGKVCVVHEPWKP